MKLCRQDSSDGRTGAVLGAYESHLADILSRDAESHWRTLKFTSIAFKAQKDRAPQCFGSRKRLGIFEMPWRQRLAH